MPDGTDVAARSQRAGRTLSPELLAGLRDAFAGEVRARLPRLRALLDSPPGEDAVRDAHALGSSAVVVGELDASRCARALEAELASGAPDRARTAELTGELIALLRGWEAP